MSVKSSIVSDEEILQSANDWITSLKKDIARAKLMESYYTQTMILTGNKQLEMLLGRTQAQIKEWEQLFNFLQNHVDTAKQ